MKKYELNIGPGYITWVHAISKESAIEYARNRYRHSGRKVPITIRGPLPEDHVPYENNYPEILSESIL